MTEVKTPGLPIGTILYHERDTQFPAEGVRPTYPYAWYCTKPFWSNGNEQESIARYTYRVTQPITKISKWKPYKEQALEFNKYEPRFDAEGDVNDYSISAFVIQVLGFEATIEEDKDTMYVVLGAETSQTSLEVVKIELFGQPLVHPGYTSLFPEGLISLEITTSPYHYTPEEIAALRQKVPPSMLCPP